MERPDMSKSSNLFLLLAGRVVSDMGTAIQAVVIPLYIIDSGGRAFTVGLCSFLSFMPAVLVYPFAGVLGDRWNRKRIMVSTDVLSGIVILSLSAAAHTDKLTLPLLMAAQAVISILNGLFDPATKGILPQLAGSNRLSRANSALSALRTLASLAGPVVGTVLYTALGIQVLFLINGVSFLLSAAGELFIRYESQKRTVKAVFMRELTGGFRFIRGHKPILRMCLFLFAIYALVQPVFTVTVPLFFKTALTYPQMMYGCLQAFIVVGALIGSILAGTAFGREGKEKNALRTGILLLTVALIGYSILLFPSIRAAAGAGAGSAGYFAVLSVALTGLSVAIMLIHVPTQTVIQRETPEQYMSRIFSVVGMMIKGGIPIGAFLYGLLLDRVEIFAVVLGSTLLVVLTSARFFLRRAR
jgi:MFS family permease